jgi:hypothetical protein
MAKAPRQLLDALQAVVSRLFQMRQLWDDAADSYFDPARFQLALQNCITVSRTVTFILQANKHEFEEFDDWYSQFQQSWGDDSIMKWAKEARNAIEKQGDLETHSQVRATIIASYIGGADSQWLPQALFASPHEIYMSVPKRFLIPHVIENGTLLVERRWVDRQLPDMEVLEALAHVYGRLADMVVSLHNHIKIPVPPVIMDTRPNAMGALAMDRAMYLSMRDGSPKGLRYFQKRLPEPEAKLRKKLVARYGTIADWEHLKQAKSFRAIAQGFFRGARALMLRDGFHVSITFFLKGPTVIHMIQTDFPDRASRYVMVRDLARLARIEGADGVMMIGEAWTAHGDDIPKSGFAAEASNRGEALVMHAVNSEGVAFALHAKIERKKNNPKKVQRIGQTRSDDDGFQFILYPFMNEWGCVNQQKLAEAIKLQSEMGIEDPRIGGKDTNHPAKG